MLTLALGRALHEYGAPAWRVEDAMQSLAARFGLAAQFFATPTSIFAAFGPEGDQRTSLLRVEPGAVDLGRRADVDELIGKVIGGDVDPLTAADRLVAIRERKTMHTPPLAVVCFGIASAAAARFLGGGANEIAVSCAAGVVVGLVTVLGTKTRSGPRVVEILAAFTVAFGALAAAQRVDLSTYTVAVAGLIVLLPGLSLTTAMSELSRNHLAAGTARFLGSVLGLLMLVFGVALGRQAGALLGWSDRSAEPLELAPWTLWIALVVAPLCFVVLLRAHRRDAGWIVASSIVAFVGSRFGAHALGPELGAFAGAIAVGAGSNLFGRITRRPSVITLVPGLLMLVPGSIGFQSLAALVEEDVVSGVATGFRMVIVAISLATGLLVANLIVPPRRVDRSAR